MTKTEYVPIAPHVAFVVRTCTFRAATFHHDCPNDDYEHEFVRARLEAERPERMDEIDGAFDWGFEEVRVQTAKRAGQPDAVYVMVIGRKGNQWYWLCCDGGIAEHPNILLRELAARFLKPWSYISKDGLLSLAMGVGCFALAILIWYLLLDDGDADPDGEMVINGILVFLGLACLGWVWFPRYRWQKRRTQLQAALELMSP